MRWRLNVFLLFFVFLFSLSFVTASVIEISNCQELQNMKNDLSAHYILTRDIDCSETRNWNGGEGFEPILDFEGILDGEGYVVRHLYINRLGANNIGLIGNAKSESVIRNINLRMYEITGNLSFVGGLVGYNEGSIERSSTLEGIIEGRDYVGGLVGVNNGSIKNSWSLASIVSGPMVGGLVGLNEGTIIKSYSVGNVRGHFANVGGFVGINYGEIVDSFWDIEYSGQTIGIGWDELNVGDALKGKSSEEMKDINIFLDAGWDIVPLVDYDYKGRWYIDNGNDYPRLERPLGFEAKKPVHYTVIVNDFPDHGDYTLTKGLTNAYAVMYRVNLVDEYFQVYDWTIQNTGSEAKAIFEVDMGEMVYFEGYKTRDDAEVGVGVKRSMGWTSPPYKNFGIVDKILCRTNYTEINQLLRDDQDYACSSSSSIPYRNVSDFEDLLIEEDDSLICPLGTCLLEDACVNLGYRYNGKYCCATGEFLPQLKTRRPCENNWECISNECSNGECVDVSSLVTRVLDWFARIFGRV